MTERRIVFFIALTDPLPAIRIALPPLLAQTGGKHWAELSEGTATLSDGEKKQAPTRARLENRAVELHQREHEVSCGQSERLWGIGDVVTMLEDWENTK